MNKTPPENLSAPRDSLAVIAVGVASLLLLQFRTLPKFSVLPAAFTSFDQFRDRLTQVVEFTGEDVLWFVMPAFCLVVLVIREWQQKSMTRLLQWIFASERRTWLGLLLLTAVWTRFYWALGETRWVGDASGSIAYVLAAAHTFKALEFPIWTNLLGVGAPYLQYYGFLFFYLVGVLDIFVRDVYISLKVSLWIGHLASAGAMYLFAREALQSRAAAFVAALAYVASFWHVQQALLMGRFPLSLFYAFLPMPFYVFERLVRGEDRLSIIGFGGVMLGVIPMVHPGYGFWATSFFVLYSILRLMTEPRCPRYATRSFIAMTLLGLVFGAYITLGMWLERGGTILEEGVLLSGVPDPSWKRVLLWSNLYFPILPLQSDEARWYGGYLGTSLLALTVVGAALNARLFRRHAISGVPVLICLALGFLLVFGYRLSALQAVPLVTALNAARYLLFVVFFLALGVGFGCRALMTFSSREGDRWSVLTIPLLIIFADLGPTTLQQPYVLKSASLISGSEQLIEMAIDKENSQRLPRGQLPPHRLLTTLGDSHPFLLSTLILELTRWPTPLAEHLRMLPSVHAFVGPFERYLTHVFHRPEVSANPDTLAQSNIVIGGLHMLNVKRLLVVHEGRSGSRVLQWPYASPVLVSGRVEPRSALEEESPPEEFVDWALSRFTDKHSLDILYELYPVVQLIADTDVHKGQNSCSRIFVADLQESRDLKTDPSAHIRAHHVWDQRVRIDLTVDEACFARLAYAFFPTLRVRVNGIEVKAMRSAGGFLVVPLDPGENRIDLTAHLSPLRSSLLALDIILMMGVAWLWRRDRQRDRQLGEGGIKADVVRGRAKP